MEFALSQGDGTRGGPPKSGKSGARKGPGWADGLRKLYDSVVEEPLPDSFDSLLRKLDQGDARDRE